MPLKFIEKEKKSKPLNDDILTTNVRDQNFEAMNSGRNKKAHSCTACVNSSSFVSTELKINCYFASVSYNFWQDCLIHKTVYTVYSLGYVEIKRYYNILLFINENVLMNSLIKAS